MKPYLVKTPGILQKSCPKRLWRMPGDQKTIYLTFDDGPIPVVTPWVLETLKKHNAKATFFCIGKNVEENPEIFRQIVHEGHRVGNHTHNHLNGNKTSTSVYMENIVQAQEVLNNNMPSHGTHVSQHKKGLETNKPKSPGLLFRPPYGKLSSRKAKLILQKGFQIVMWDVLSADFDQRASKEKCMENVLKHTETGSIVIFHDSIKAEENLRYSLPGVLSHFSEKGYAFKAIS